MDKKNLIISSAGSIRDRLEELQQRAMKDKLSGLLNRDTVEQCVKERLQAMSQGDTCALFIVDLDDFKQVNDTLGHQAGDEAIRQSARILSGLFRASDIVGRLGGDEFAIFLCGNITEELVRRKAAEICEVLQLVLGDRRTVSLTASVGVHLAGRGQEFEGLYQSADLALYKAKKSGKHRFCLKNGEVYQEGEPKEFRPVNSIPLGRLLECMDSGLVLLEMEDSPRVIYVSPSFCRIVGADPKTYPLPQPLADLIHPDDLLPLVQALREGLSHGQMVEHTHRVSVRGGEQWAWWHVRAMQIEYDGPNPVMLVTTTDISQFKEKEEDLKEINQRLQAAFDQTYQLLWEVDLPSRTFSMFQRDGRTRIPEYDRTAFPEHLIEGGWIHPNSMTRFRTFAQQLLNGQGQGFGNFIIRRQGSYSWVTLSYRMLFDEIGRAVRAVGILEDLPQGSAGRSDWTFAHRPLPEGLIADLIVHIRANLERDEVEAFWVEGSDLSSQVQKTKCSDVLQMERDKIFGREEKKAFLTYFNDECLLQMYREGRRWLVAEYQRSDNGGGIHWVRQIVYLEEDPAAHQIYLFFYLIRLDPRCIRERAACGDVLQDVVSPLYDQDAIQQAAEVLFADEASGNRAVAVLQISGLPQHPVVGGLQADQMRFEIAAALSLALGGSCILGQYSANQIVLVFPAVTAKEDLRRQLDKGLAFLRRMLHPETEYRVLRFVTGTVILSTAAANYSMMLAQALRTCALWSDSRTDTVAFAQEMDDWNWTQMAPMEEHDQVSVYSSEMTRPLSEQEKDVALDCVSTMLSARTLDAALLGVLQTIGVYYHADRVYTLILVENRRAVVMTFEWARPGKRSIQQVVSGMRLERFPLLERCLAECAPVFLARRDPSALKGGSREVPSWYFTAFPLIRDREVTGFLCIENAQEHPTDAALFGTLIPYILQQRERFRREEHVERTIEQLAGRSDRRAYLAAIQTLTSEHLSSLGTVCLDIPGIMDTGVSGGDGFEYGSKLLWYVTKTLSDLFGSSLLFRVLDAEFVIFFPNTTREVFLGRCGRLRSILQRRYPKRIRIGRAWAEGVFTAKRLVKEAEAAMHAVSAGPAAAAQMIAERTAMAGAGGSEPSDSQFTVYFQPKVDMRTGKLAGAEALVRGIADDGSIVPPSQFIQLLEEDGIIRELDLIVLERTLAQAERWQREGLGTVPVAVNMSRLTMAHSSTLASVLAVQSRYPGIPPEALELEITERGSGIDNEELQGIVERFRSCGLQLCLDDFGSQYANLPLFTNVRFDTVKLDRSLIAEVVSNPINHMLVKNIIQICQTYHMDCVAEGVENADQVSALVEMGCIYGQGFYYDRPLPAEEFERKYLRSAAPAVQEE